MLFRSKAFTLQTDDGQGDIQFRNIVLLYTNAASYVFEYVYPNARKDMIGNDYKAFVNSIKLSPELQRHDQYLSNAKGMSPVMTVGLIGGGVLVIILVVLYVQRKRRLELVENN